jgi:hypothetical protein
LRFFDKFGFRVIIGAFSPGFLLCAIVLSFLGGKIGFNRFLTLKHIQQEPRDDCLR